MANISSASGTITLKGRWSQKALSALYPVLDMWEFYGEYGIQYYDGFSEEDLTSDFHGCGRWGFGGTIESFDDWTREWLKTKPKNENGELIHKLTEEEYDDFLKIMDKGKLKIQFDYTDEVEGYYSHEIVELKSNGENLIFNTLLCEEVSPSWDDLEDGLYNVVSMFKNFLSDPDEEELERWIRNNIPANASYEYLDYSDPEEFLNILGESYEIPPFRNFIKTFSPDTEDWEEFCEIFQDVFSFPIKDTESKEKNLYKNENKEETEPDNPWNDITLPVTDNITEIQFENKRFVLTGQFQNLDGDAEKIKELITEKHGTCTKTVSGKTDYLIVGDFTEKETKPYKDAISQKNKGSLIKIISEYDLFKFL